jgi:SRSO17 transposase
LQWFLSESDWNERAIQQCRLHLLLEEPSTSPSKEGVLVIDEHGVSLDGHKTAHVGKQYLANLGKIDTGVVSVTSLWANARVYYPVDARALHASTSRAKVESKILASARNSSWPWN